MAGLSWSDIIVTPRKGGGLSNLDRRIHKRLGHLELRKTGERMGLGEGVSLSGSLDPTWSRQGHGVGGGSK